jgi:hypothetical protein
MRRRPVLILGVPPLALAAGLSVGLHGSIAALIWSTGELLPRPERAAVERVRPPAGPAEEFEIERPELPEPEQVVLGVDGGDGFAFNDFLSDAIALLPNEAEQDQAPMSLQRSGQVTPERQLRQARPNPVGPTATALLRPPAPDFLGLAPPPTPTGGAAGDDGEADQQQDAVAAATPGTDSSRPDPRPAGNASVSATATQSASLVIEAGRITARDGREFRPGDFQPFLAQRTQTMFVKLPQRVVVRLTLDDDGTVLDVHFVQQTPSTAFNRSLQLWLYASWFEPDPAKEPDEVTFTIVLR